MNCIGIPDDALSALFGRLFSIGAKGEREVEHRMWRLRLDRERDNPNGTSSRRTSGAPVFAISSRFYDQKIQY
jgi:hypothetical protein